MEKLSTIQTQGNLNEVFRVGEPGPGGAYHDYQVKGDSAHYFVEEIRFQKGPRNAQDARRGVLDTDLMEIVRDRLKAFQDGPYACQENEHALFLVEQALVWMNRRTEDRIKRNVLGTMNK